MGKNGFATEAERCYCLSLNMSQQHNAIILNISKIEKALIKTKHASTLKKLTQWTLVRHLLE